MKRTIALLLVCLSAALAAPVDAMENRGPDSDGSTQPWSWPERIPQYNTPLDAPLLVADDQGVAHSFNLESDGGQGFSIIHRTWTLSQGWSAPVDVLLPKDLGLSPTLKSVFLDADGMIHLVYIAGDQIEGDVYYSRVSADEAGRAEAWSDPVPIGPNAGGVAAATISGNDAGELLLLYGGHREGLGLYAVYSVDGGITWSAPSSVWRAPGEEIWPASISLAADDSGQFHAVWDTSNSLGQGVEIGYARLAKDLVTWEHSTTLARQAAAEDMVGAPSILTSGERLVVVYQDGFPPTKMMRQSNDRGATWSLPVRPFPYVGAYGDVAMVKDSLGTIHMVLGNRYPIPETYGMWYSRLEGSQWTPLEPIIAGQEADSFDSCCPETVICNGNVLLATWPHGTRGEALTAAWYAHRVLDAPPLREDQGSQSWAAIAPTPPPVPDADLTPTPEADATPTPSSGGASASPGPPPANSNPGVPVYLGLVPVVVLVIAVLRRRGRPLPHQPANKSGGSSPGDRAR